MMNDFKDYLKRNAYSDSSTETYLRIVEVFLKWCAHQGYDIENMTYGQCTEYFKTLQERKTKKQNNLKDTTIKSYTGAVKVYFDYLVSEDVYSVSPIEDYSFIVTKGYEHELLSAKELELLYVCFPTMDIGLPNCRHVAVRNKVVAGLVVFQGLDTRILKRLTTDHIDLDRGKIRVPGTRVSEPKTYRLRNEQITVLRRYLQEDRPVLQNKVDSHSEALFPLNSDRFGIIASQVVKVLRTINYKVVNLQQLRASVIAQWVQHEDLRQAQKLARHRFITSTENYRKYDPSANRSAADVFHVMR